MTAMTVRRCRRVQRLFTVLRWAEAVTVVVVSLRFAPSFARASSDFLRLSLSVLLGPRFLFLLGNAIVLLLFFFSSSSSSTNNNNDPDHLLSSFVPPPPPPLPPPTPPEELLFQDKEVVHVSPSSSSAAARACRRSRSERMRKPSAAPELRRSKTGVDPTAAEEDAEEFRRTVEAFIAKQLKFQRQESVSASALAIIPAPPDSQEKEE